MPSNIHKYSISTIRITWEYVRVYLREELSASVVYDDTTIVPHEVILSFDPYHLWGKSTKLAQKRYFFGELKNSAERYGWYEPDNMIVEGWDTLRSQAWERFTEAFPICETCDLYHSQRTYEVFSCDNCDAEMCELVVNNVQTTYDLIGRLCRSCSDQYYNDIHIVFPNVRNCVSCRRVEYVDSFVEVEGTDHCSYCVTRLPICAVCSRRMGRRSGINYEGYGRVHMECSQNLPKLGHINSWDYRPTPVFYPDVPENPVEPLYVGMELEVSRNYDGYSDPDLGSLQFLGELPEFFYAKHDSSVNDGFEIVTHPMQPLWALENFPFDLFNDVVEEGILKSSDESAGTHMHMNKDSFVPAHMWKFLQLHFRLPQFCEAVGGRRNSSWARFGGSDNARLRKDLVKLAKKQGEPNYDRYVAVNLRNEYTIELRYPRGGIRPSHIRKNLEWAHAAYTYTNQLSVSDINAGALNTANDITEFINNDSVYDDLSEWISKQERVGWRWETM